MSQREQTAEQALKAVLAFWAEAGLEWEAPAPAPAPRSIPQNRLDSAPKSEQKRRENAQNSAKNENAEALAAACQTLPALAEALAAFDGCALKKTARNLVFAEGPFDAPVFLIGERPGREEDEAGKPFVGRSGRLLDQMLAAIGLDRGANVCITNVVFWRPPGDRQATQAEIAACLPFLRRALALARPKALLLTGGAPLEMLLGAQSGIMKLRGKRLSYRDGDWEIPALATLHPAYLLRRPQDKRLAWADLLAFEDWLIELGCKPD